MSRTRSSDPVQQDGPQASAGMSDPVEKVTGPGRSAARPPRDRGGLDRTGFSAEAVPLRPAEERSGEQEREERLRLLTTHPARRLPVGRPHMLVASGFLGVVLLLVGAALVIGKDGAHRPPATGRVADGAFPRREAAKVLAPPVRGHQATATASHRRHRPPRRRRPGRHRRRHPEQTRRRPTPQPRGHVPVASSMPTEAPVVAPVAESTPPVESAPAPEPSAPPEPAAGATPAPEATQATPTPTHTDESSAARESSTLEGQFGFER